jgi:hypothetical protein
MMLDERVIEIDIMGDEYAVGQQVENMRGNLIKNRGISNHLVADPC